jgi:hypothetical protein
LEVARSLIFISYRLNIDQDIIGYHSISTIYAADIRNFPQSYFLKKFVKRYIPLFLQ